MAHVNDASVDTQVEDKSPKIFAFDDLHPEDNAMLQALYSRSPASVVTHLDKIKKTGSGHFMANYYVGYGHASIGDCGVTTLFMENYSMLAAKAIQDNQLYSGQEASTRYLNFADQPLHDPFGRSDTADIQKKWLDLYNTYMPQIQAALALEHPFDPDAYKSETVWDNALKARSFDIMRSFLPVGATTLFSWTTNLRQARDRLMQLRNHPLPEIQTLAQDLFATLKEKYPYSFNGTELEEGSRYAARHHYAEKHGAKDHIQTFQDVCQRYALTSADENLLRSGGVLFQSDHLDIQGLNQHESEALAERPQGAQLPYRLKAYGVVNILCTLDFGSFRDLQRHRGGVCLLPEVNADFGFNQWYLSEIKRLLPDSGEALKEEISKNLQAIQRLKEQGEDPQKLQYLYPMGMNVIVDLTYTLPQIQYVSELRSGKAVHSSLRPIAQEMARFLETHFPDIALYADMDQDNWTVKRGEQTIQEKKKYA